MCPSQSSLRAYKPANNRTIPLNSGEKLVGNAHLPIGGRPSMVSQPDHVGWLDDR